VTAIDLCYCSFATPDNKEIYIPNSQISAARIINYNRLGRRRIDLNFTASYDAPTETVKTAIREVLDGLPQILSDPAPAIWLSEYQSSSIQYVVRVWVAAADYWDVYYGITEGVRESFDRHNVEMTYDHLNVHVLNK
jgi:small conductance mechanosensitive channel